MRVFHAVLISTTLLFLSSTGRCSPSGDKWWLSEEGQLKKREHLQTLSFSEVLSEMKRDIPLIKPDRTLLIAFYLTAYNSKGDEKRMPDLTIEELIESIDAFDDQDILRHLVSCFRFLHFYERLPHHDRLVLYNRIEKFLEQGHRESINFLTLRYLQSFLKHDGKEIAKSQSEESLTTETLESLRIRKDSIKKRSRRLVEHIKKALLESKKQEKPDDGVYSGNVDTFRLLINQYPEAGVEYEKTVKTMLNNADCSNRLKDSLSENLLFFNYSEQNLQFVNQLHENAKDKDLKDILRRRLESAGYSPNRC